MVKANQHELKLNGTYQLLIYGDHVDLLNGNTHTHTHTLQKNTEVLLLSIKEIVTNMNAEETIYKFKSHEENVGQNHNTDIGNKTFERVATFRLHTQRN